MLECLLDMAVKWRSPPELSGTIRKVNIVAMSSSMANLFGPAVAQPETTVPDTNSVDKVRWGTVTVPSEPSSCASEWKWWTMLDICIV